VTGIEITHAEQASWQRRAAAGLVAILASHRDLPEIAWTVGAAGATLAGRVDALQPAREVRRVFEVWRQALALTEHSDVTCGGGTVYLRAVARHDRVSLTLTATVLDDEGEG
jgi:hypothetical protein